MEKSFLARVAEMKEREQQQAVAAATETHVISPYGRRALQDEMTRLRAATEGSRNATLNEVSFNLGQLIGSGELPETQIVDELFEAGIHIGLGDNETRATIKSGIEAGRRSPRSGAAPASPPPAPLRVLKRSELRDLPDPKPLVENVFDQGTTALLYGKWGTAKSFIALDWAASVATGRAWQGRGSIQRKVLYVAAEGAYGFKARIDAWERGWHHAIDDAWFGILPEPVNLTRTNEVAALAHLIRAKQYGFVVMDTLARCMVGADENSAKDCGAVVSAMSRLVEATPGSRGTVLGVHHAGKDGKTFRGSSAFEAGADTVYFSKREGNSFSLTREKRKDGPQEDRHFLTLDPIDGTGSCVMSTHGPETGGTRADTLRSIVSQHFGSTGVGKTELRQVAVDEGPMTRPTFYRALNDLLEDGFLVNTGTDRQPFYKVS